MILLEREFQSHNGAIAAKLCVYCFVNLQVVSIPQWCDCCRGDEHDGRKPKTSFNPTMVRLLLAVSSGTFVGYLLVSIPQWCDCCKFEVLPQRCDDGVSIPQWCDCCVVGFGL